MINNQLIIVLSVLLFSEEPKNEETQVAELDQQGEYVNQQGVRFTASDPVEEGIINLQNTLLSVIVSSISQKLSE